MRLVAPAMTQKWKDPAKIGADARPAGRVTVQPLHRTRVPYLTHDGPDRAREERSRGTLNSFWFGNPKMSVELPNVRTISWGRNVDTDVAEVTITLHNVAPLPMGSSQSRPEQFDKPGFYTPSAGRRWSSANPWGYDAGYGWGNRLVPDNIIRTYEGYGLNPFAEPAYDENLEQTGMWFIDEVSFSDDGEITIRCRDAGRLMMDAINFPTVIPMSEYPITWQKVETIDAVGRTATGGSWGTPSGNCSSSNQHQGGERYLGHKPADVLSGASGSYWLSRPQSSASSKVWWQINLNDPVDLAALKIAPHRGPYRVYVSLANDDGWIGRRDVPYRVTDGNVHADIPYVQAFNIDETNLAEWVLRKKYKGIKKIRLTFSRLTPTGDADGADTFTGALRTLRLYTGAYSSLGFGQGTYKKVVGNHRDLTDIVKWLSAWAGFYWPPVGSGADNIRYGTGPAEPIQQATEDLVLPRGRVWGDFMKTGTTLAEPITPDAFDKQPLTDIVAHLREICGFNFWFDETGAVVWRMPNLWSLGNYVTPSHHASRSGGTPARVPTLHQISEEDLLLEHRVSLSSRNIRERVFVSDGTAKKGVVAAGMSYGSGLRRVAGWTDGNWKTLKECIVAADMIVARQTYEFRKASITIPGYPGIQIDDQIQITERTTRDTHVHYVSGIQSTLNNETGEYTYELDTFWLGTNPQDSWAVDVTRLNQLTRNFLNATGAI